ncbi:hypothetical protein F5Y03DRAFT_379058 [Xylaria venustula]|nr:hypothetical protein F5Y03DRAFT_379058 [Xylaria venustula]
MVLVTLMLVSFYQSTSCFVRQVTINLPVVAFIQHLTTRMIGTVHRLNPSNFASMAMGYDRATLQSSISTLKSSPTHVHDR